MARHGTTSAGRFPGRQDLQFVYPPHTTASMAAERLARLPAPPFSPHHQPCIDLRLLIAPCCSAFRADAGSPSSAVASDAPTAAKQKSCAQQVIDDWFDDGRVNKIYPLPCYPEAIKKLPPDVLDLRQRGGGDRSRAGLRQAGEARSGRRGSDPVLDDDDDDTTTKTTTTKTGTTATDTTTTTDTTETDTTATDTSGPSSVPVPLLVLGGLAVLLLAAGSAGYLRRRMNGDDDGDGSTTPPPARLASPVN